MIDSSQDAEISGKLFDPHLMRRLLRFVIPYKIWMGLALIILVFMALANNFLPILIQRAIDHYLIPGMDPHLSSSPFQGEERGAGDYLNAERVRGLVKIATAYLSLAAFAFFLRFAQGYLMSWIGQKVIFDMRADIFSKILRLPLGFFDRTHVGRLMTRVTSDVESMQRLLTDGLIGLFADLFTLVGILGFMFYLSPRLTLIMILLFPFLLTVLTYINVKIRGAHRQVRRRQSALNAYLQEMLTGMLTVQLFNQENKVQTKFDAFNASLKKALILSIHWFSYFFPSIEILNALSVALVVIVGGLSNLQDGGITLGMLIAFIAYVRDFFRPLEDLSDKSNILQSAMASAERVFALMDTPEVLLDPAVPATLSKLNGDIVFDHVWFAYQNEDWVLKDVSLHIQPGESVAIVGATGAGKSTVISLIARFYDVVRGSVKLDHVDVRDQRQAELRKKIGLVMQDPFIFSGSIADNIGLRNPEITREQIMAAARFVNAHTFIEGRLNGYDTEVMERGAKLSTGQKQLLALARALAQNPDILLILDEATANVDTETESLIQDALKKVMKGRTSIIIAHRLSTIKDVDRILVMRHGQIIEQGKHTELLRANGYYRKLYDLLAHQPPA